MEQKRKQLQLRREQMQQAGGANPRSSTTADLRPEQTQKRRKRVHAEEATASPNQQAAATPPAAAEPRLTALNPVPTVGSAVSAVAKMFGAIDIAAARHPNSHSPAQEQSRKRKCSGRAK